ncbi:MAG: cyclophane-forming radical SAM/SPASM peptide maturase GrrM/OscB [Vulcanococcus sp.]
MAVPDGGPLRLLVLQPTPFCNLDCDYCYLPTRDNRSRLSLEILDAALERVLESPYLDGPFTLLWHAGEPLTVPPAFYDAATSRLRAALARHGLPTDLVRQSLQTNAISINASWCDCFVRNDIHVGVSLDGPAFLHDAHRRTRSGLPSHDAVMRGIAWLQRRGVPFNVIAVLTAEGLDHADALYDFFTSHGISELGFNMEETEGENRRSSLDGAAAQAGLEARYRRFMQRFWQRCLAEPGRLHLREFEGITSLAGSNQRLRGTDMNTPFVIVNVDAQGRMSTFDPELLAVHTERFGDFVFGHVRHDRLVDIAANPKFQQVQAEIAAGVQACRSSCEYFGLCGGGTGSNKYWEHGRLDGAATQHCRYRIQLVADVVVEGMEQELGLAS